AEYKFAEEKARIKASGETTSIGAYLNAVTELATDQRPRTLESYAGCVRRIAGDILARKGGRASREKVEALPLQFLSNAEIERWKADRIRACGGNPIKEDATRITANSILRSCRAIFGRKLLTEGRREVLKKAGLLLPDPLPFSKCLLFEEDTSGKFSHDVGVEALMAAAVKELGAESREGESGVERVDRRQRFVAFLLVFAAGLRKSEADALEWNGIDLEGGTLTVRTTEFFRPKTKASQRPVRLDPDVVEMLRRFRAENREDQFVLKGSGLPKPGSKYAYYRCEATWKGLAAWLWDKGVRDRKPIHYLRKASAAFVARKFGIFAAQRHARHTTPTITQRYYSDSDDSVTPGFGLTLGAQNSAFSDGERSSRNEKSNLE
ncbi:MAG: tyrosine-type recombinase/integrase, partial [Candidatus Omnitrophica bacterium]|nr:tyrosine-type recombinase/integrase [Candidatus Omnitrophota bacterium]